MNPPTAARTAQGQRRWWRLRASGGRKGSRGCLRCVIESLLVMRQDGKARPRQVGGPDPASSRIEPRSPSQWFSACRRRVLTEVPPVDMPPAQVGFSGTDMRPGRSLENYSPCPQDGWMKVPGACQTVPALPVARGSLL